jgi:hypothetical protein
MDQLDVPPLVADGPGADGAMKDSNRTTFEPECKCPCKAEADPARPDHHSGRPHACASVPLGL